MLLAKIICSDPKCVEELEISIPHLMKLDGFVCQCGFGFVLESVSEVSDRGGEVISMARRRPPAKLPAAKRQKRAA
jgi:hypothetical protein